VAAGLRDEGKVEWRHRWRDTERMKERQKMQAQKEEQDFLVWSQYILSKIKSRGSVWMKSTGAVLHVTCTNNDGMENHD